MKKILIATVLFFFCLSSANAFLAKTKKIDPEDYPFLLLAKDLQIYNIKLDLSGLDYLKNAISVKSPNVTDVIY